MKAAMGTVSMPDRHKTVGGFRGDPNYSFCQFPLGLLSPIFSLLRGMVYITQETSVKIPIHLRFKAVTFRILPESQL